MGYKIKYSRTEKKANEVLAKQNKQDKKDKEILNLIPLSSGYWIDAREDKDDFVLI
jgi:hypothetical protein